MSAGTRRATTVQERSTTRAGYTSISSGTMTHLLSAIAAEAFGVQSADVKAGIHSEQGQVSVSLAVPLTLETAKNFSRQRTGHEKTIFDRASTARAHVISRLHELAGTSISRVDVRYTGIQSTVGRVQ